MTVRIAVSVRGIVQGVGFRPFVYRIATREHLSGWIKNRSDGVRLEVQGTEETLQHFLDTLRHSPPPAARIERIDVTDIAAGNDTGFAIIDSSSDTEVRATLPADLATCAACIAEVETPEARRYGYAFTNCAHCGPRYSIIDALPYDRVRTTMGHFQLCEACAAELHDPNDRRFHAQPIACPVCGPSLRLLAPSLAVRGESLAAFGRRCIPSGRVAPRSNTPGILTRRALPDGRITGLDATPDFHHELPGEEIARDAAALQHALQTVVRGEILAMKGLGGFHLLCDAANDAAVTRLRQRKAREEKPLAVMFPSIQAVRLACDVSAAEAELLSSPEAPIVLLRRHQVADARVRIADTVAPRNPWLGVMLPYTPLHHLLLRGTDRPLVCTSGNLSEEPMCTDQAAALDRLGGVADLFLVHDRPIARPLDDSVVRVVGGSTQTIRRARGYAPLPLSFAPTRTARWSAGHARSIVALGGHMKSTVALATGEQVIVSQHLGDLTTIDGALHFERAVSDLLRFFEARPTLIACDMHPDYHSTRFAEQMARSWSVPVEHVQHHHAHVAACMAEHGLSGPVLGLAWDGSGLGTDGTLWGGEALVVDGAAFTRVAHLRPFSLPGAELAIREPRRAAAGILHEVFGADAIARYGKMWAAADARILHAMLDKRIHVVRTTSMGRLFDAVAALSGVRSVASFEGQAAMELEFAAAGTNDVAAYPLPLEHGEPAVANWEPLLREVLRELDAGVPAAFVAARFHNSVANLAVEIACRIGLQRVVLTGGCFQNARLLQTTRDRLLSRGFEVHTPQQYPPNDGGLSLGQAFVAAHRHEVDD